MKLFGRWKTKEETIGANMEPKGLGSGDHLSRLALAERNLQTTRVEPAEAVKRIKNFVRNIGTSHPSSPVLTAYAIALSSQAQIVSHLNQDPLVTAPVYFDDAIGLPSFSTLLADLVSYSSTFEPEPLHRAILDSFSGWTVAGEQKFEGCHCGEKPVILHLDIMLRHQHEARDGRLVIEQLLGIKLSDTMRKEDKESHGKAHLENHYSGFTQKTDTENLVVVGSSRAVIELVDGIEYGTNGHRVAKEETKHANEIDIAEWQSLLANMLNSPAFAPTNQPDETTQNITVTV